MVIKVVSVGENDDGRIFHRRFQHEPPGVKRHREGFAGALRVPDDSGALVARFASGLLLRVVASRLVVRIRCPCCCCRPDRLGDGYIDRVELVVAGDFFDDGVSVVLENDEVPDEIEESAFYRRRPVGALRVAASWRGRVFRR